MEAWESQLEDLFGMSWSIFFGSFFQSSLEFFSNKGCKDEGMGEEEAAEALFFSIFLCAFQELC